MKRLIFHLLLLMSCLVGGSEAWGQDFGFGGYQVVSSNRVGRTEYEYVMRVMITNGVASAQGVSAEVYSWTEDTEIVEGNVSFGNLALGGSAVGSDTFTIRQNRLVAFDPMDLQWFVTVQSMPLAVTVESPVSGLLTNGTVVQISGQVGAGVAGVRVGGVLASLSGSRFTALYTLEEGRNTISVLATNTYGGSGVVNLIVNRDTTPPILSIDTPAAGSVVASRQVTVTGQINDVVPGTVNPEQATVMVNDLAATVLNRSYALSEVLLVPGTNRIVAVGRDRAGNESRKQIEVVFQDPASQKRLVPLAGAGQIGMINTTLPERLVVELVDGNGVVQTNQAVTFKVSRNDGALLATPEVGRELTVLTDDKGQAGVQFQLGSRSGVGNNEVLVSSAGVAVPVQFSASSTGAPPVNVVPLIPETQVGSVSQALPLPWTALVTDAGGNPVEGASLSFTVTQGGGSLGGATTIVTNTDSDGRAKVIHTLGAEAGVNNQVVTATVGGLSNAAAVFTASAQVPGPASQTRIIGVVLDNANRPMSNILCRVENTMLVTVTDLQGQFVISNAPVGAVRLNVDARDRGYGGNWHSLQFDLVTVAGRDNQVDRPIYMLPLDVANSKMAGGSEDVMLSLAGVPGSSLTIFAGSVRDNNNQPATNRVLWTQVNLERVPMAPPIGSQFTLAWTVQPINMRFDPPARVCLPNSGFAPGQVVEMFGFDHDINAFVSLGQGTVSIDGSQICSNPGFGITKSGWGGFVPPAPPCTPICGGPPADTDCAKYETIPAASACDCPTYKPIDEVKITKVEAKVDGTNDLVKCYATNQMLAFTSTVEQTNCSTLEYKWEFGDGQESTDQAPTHSYTNGGEYSVKLTVTCKECPSAQKDGTAKVKLYELKKLIVADNADATNVRTNPAANDVIVLATNTAKAKISAEIVPNNADAKKHILWRVDGNTAAPNKGDFSAASVTSDLTVNGGNRSFAIKAGCDQNHDGTLQDGEVTHTLNFHLATIAFAKNAAQKFGFDEDKTNGVHYLSIDKNDTTKVDVTVNPYVAGGYWATSSDKAKVAVPGDAFTLTAASSAVDLTGKNSGGNHESLQLEIRAYTNSGPILTNLHVEAYKENQIAKVTYYRLLDSTVAATRPAKNPSFADLKTEMNKIYKQAVIEILDVDGSTNQNLRFDLNNNGFMDYYNNEANSGPEVKALTDAALAGDPKIAYVEKLRDNWRLAAAAPAGTNKIVLVNAAGTGLQGYTLGPAIGGGEGVTVTARAGNVLTLSANLASAHAATDTLYSSLAGISTNPQLVTDAGGELLVTIVHEMMHRAAFGNLTDVAQKDNTMYWTTGGTGEGFLRFRPQTTVDTGTGVPDGGTENQWNKVAR